MHAPKIQTLSRTETANSAFQLLTIALVGLLSLAGALHIVAGLA